jgi:phosphohistidine phosphatase
MEVVRRIYLLRHAKSSWGDPSVGDHERPLSPRGERAARDMATHLSRGAVRPGLVLCSSALRARQTFEALSLASEVVYEDGLYGAEANELLARLRQLPESLSSVMMVGHNPATEELAARLSGKGGPDLLGRLREGLPTGALVQLAFQGTWASLAGGAATLEALVLPRDL